MFLEFPSSPRMFPEFPRNFQSFPRVFGAPLKVRNFLKVGWLSQRYRIFFNLLSLETNLSTFLKLSIHFSSKFAKFLRSSWNLSKVFRTSAKFSKLLRSPKHLKTFWSFPSIFKLLQSSRSFWQVIGAIVKSLKFLKIFETLPRFHG